MEGSTIIPTAMTEVTIDPSSSSNTELFLFEDYIQRIVLAIVICIVFLVGTIGNTLVIIAVVLSRKLRASTNWFIVNLGCADLLTCLSFPLNVVAMLSRDGWPLPDWICATNSAVSPICLNTSVMTLGFIAYNRWYLLTKPKAQFQKLYTTRNVCFMVASTWVYPSLLVLVPAFAGLGRLGYSNEYKTCTQDTSLPYSEFYSLITGAGAMIPVFIAIVVSYVRIYFFVSRQRIKIEQTQKLGVSKARRTENTSVEMSSSEISSSKPSAVTSDSQSHSFSKVDTPQTSTMAIVRDTSNEISSCKPTQSDARPARSLNQNPGSKVQPRVNRYHVTVTKRLAIVVLAFFICLLPFGVSVGVPASDPVIPWTGLLVIVNSCINPLIYARTMTEFRKVMWAIIRCHLQEIPEPITCIRRKR